MGCGSTKAESVVETNTQASQPENVNQPSHANDRVNESYNVHVTSNAPSKTVEPPEPLVEEPTAEAAAEETTKPVE
jgi:hypothetical protein